MNDLGHAIGGCILDMVRPQGPVLLRETPAALGMASARFKARKVRVSTPPLDRLPESPLDAFERLAPGKDDDPSAPSAFQISGAAFLVQRARLAASLFARRADYHDFALRRLARVAQDDIAAIARDFAAAFPDLPPDDLANVARASRAGLRSLSATTTPTDADLAGVLAAWLGDVPASDLFSEWEMRLCDARIERGADGAAFARWAALRARLGYPSDERIVTPLVLTHDPRTDRVGFYRIVLPRPESFTALAAKASALRADDRVPSIPLGLWLVDRIASIPEAGEPLHAHGYRVVSIRYDRPDDPGRKAAKAVAGRDHVVLRLSDGHSRSLDLDAVLDTLEDGTIELSRLAPSVTGDPELAAFFDGLGGGPSRTDSEPPAPSPPSSPPG